MKKKNLAKLTQEEQAISDSFDRGEWQSVRDMKKEKTKARQAATDYLSKNARINIRISMNDLEQIKQRAAFEGMPYQTLIASILHKYAAGHF